MMLISSLSAVVGLASVVAAVHDGSHQMEAAHHKRATHHNSTAHPRGQTFSGQATYFYVGLGACGQYSQDSDYMVALNTPQYGGGSPGPQCFKSITISALGKTATATILDECPSCDYGSLDLSPGLFQHFGDEGLGVFPITWWFNDGSNSGNNDNDQKTTTSTKQWVAPTTTSTTTHHTTTSTTSTTPTTTSVSTTSVASSSSATESSVTSTGTASSASGSATSGPSTGSNNTKQGGGISSQQRLVANFGYMASTGRQHSSS